MPLYPRNDKAHSDTKWCLSLVSLSDTEVEPPASSLWRAVHQQAVDGIDLVADIEADRANRRRVTQPGANRVPEIAQREPARALPHVAAVQKQDAAEFAAQRRPDFFAEREHAVPAN